MKKLPSLMPSVQDREISALNADAFGHRHLAKALESLIESPSNDPPYSIGVLGKWGTGKTTIRSFYLSSLLDDQSKDAKGRTRAERIHHITFAAWRFGGENIKRALLRQVFLGLEGDETALNDKLFRQIQRVIPEAKSYKNLFQDIYDRFIWGCFPLGIAASFLILLLYFLNLLVPVASSWANAFIQVITVIAATFIVKYLTDPARLSIPRYTNVTNIESPNVSAEQYEELLISQLHEYKSGNTKSKKGKYCQRLVIFVDDLDRLSAEEMVSGLDAIRTFMDIPKNRLPKELGIVFVISCDEEKVADALADRRKQVASSELPGAVRTQGDARLFLDRIFQFRLDVPPFPRQDMRSYALERLKKDMADITDDIATRNVPLENVVERMIHVGVQNPRQALQIINTFAQTWWLARQRELDGAGTSTRGGLQEGAVTNHPEALAVLSAIRVSFPDFYADLQQEPDLISRFTDVVIHNSDFDSQSELTQLILSRYLTGDKELKPAYRALRQFIASIEGMQWPPTITPLLLLSQDPITRRFGDKIRPLYDALVSADYAGAVAELGLNTNSRNLNAEEVELLYDINTDLQKEVAIRRNNAAAVIASLHNRLSPEFSRKLLGPLAQRLTQSSDLRWRVGLERIGYIVENASAVDRRAVIAALIDDLLRTQQDIDFKLESGQTPSLDEAVGMVQRAVPMILDVYQPGELSRKHQNQLLSWLITRRVALSGKAVELPFQDLQMWMEKHEGKLLPGLRERYTDQVIAELEAERLGNDDAKQPLRLTAIVVESLWSDGESSRVIYWNQLIRMISVRNQEAVAFAWGQAKSHITNPESTTYSRFMHGFARRLVQEVRNQEEWSLDWETAIPIFTAFLTQRGQELTKDAITTIGELGKLWADEKDTAKYAIQVFNQLMILDMPTVLSIAGQLVPDILKDLQAEVRDWLAQNYERFASPTLQQQFVGQMDVVLQRTTITPDEASHYDRILSMLPRAAMVSNAIQVHLESMLVQLQNNYNNPNSYIERIFPVVPKLLDVLPSAQLGATLHTLMANTNSDQRLYSWLHSQMVGKWPNQSTTMAPYDLNNIFNWGKQAIDTYPDYEGSHYILASIYSLIKQGLVDSSNIPVVFSAAHALWPKHRKQALIVFMELEEIPTDGVIVGLVDGVVPDDDAIADLSSVWKRVCKSLDVDRLTGLTLLLLRKPLVEGDVYLKVWFDSQTVRVSNLLIPLQDSDQLPEEHLIRIWQQVVRLAGLIDISEFVQLLNSAFHSAMPQSVSLSIISHRRDITQRYSLREERYELGKELMRTFLSSNSLEVKNSIAEWIKDMDVDAVLKDIPSLGDYTDEDIDILMRIMGRKQGLQRLLRQK